MTTFDVQFGERPVTPANISRRPIAEIPMVAIKDDAIGNVIPDDEPELTVVQPWDFEIDPEAESVEEAFGLVPIHYGAAADIKSESPA